MKNRGIEFALAFAASLACASPSAASNLVVNGGFEDGFNGWLQSGNTDYSGAGGGFVNSGALAAYFGPVGSIGSISQTLNTVIGQSYDVSFYLQNSGGGTNSFSVLFGGGPAAISYSNQAAMPWTKLDFSAVATSAFTTLQFSFRHDPSLFYLDDVSVVQSVTVDVPAAPEPESWAMMLTGFGLTGLALRRSAKRRPISGLLFDHR